MDRNVIKELLSINGLLVDKKYSSRNEIIRKK